MKPGDHPEFFRFPAPEGRSRESTIVLDRDGRLWHEGVLVEHDRLAEAMHGWIARHPDDGRFILTNGYDWTYFTVEDAPFTVRSAHLDEQGRVILALSGGARVPLDPAAVSVAADGSLYATVELPHGTFEARFDRHAQAQLEPALVEIEDGVAIRSGGVVAIPRPRFRMEVIDEGVR